MRWAGFCTGEGPYKGEGYWRRHGVREGTRFLFGMYHSLRQGKTGWYLGMIGGGSSLWVEWAVGDQIC